MVVDGAERTRLDRDGHLRLTTAGGELTLRRPVAYQERDGAREPVTAEYRLAGEGEVRFALGEWDSTRALVIDPVLVYSTFMGGGATDSGTDIARDAGGNTYVVGNTGSMDSRPPRGHELAGRQRHAGCVRVEVLADLAVALQHLLRRLRRGRAVGAGG